MQVKDGNDKVFRTMKHNDENNNMHATIKLMGYLIPLISPVDRGSLMRNSCAIYNCASVAVSHTAAIDSTTRDDFGFKQGPLVWAILLEVHLFTDASRIHEDGDDHRLKALLVTVN
jgi:hypothetical protein